MSVNQRMAWRLPLILTVGLFASISEASQPAPARRSPATNGPKATQPPARKQLDLSPEIRERLSQATVKRAPVKYIPFAKKDVRARIPPSQRPERQANGKPKRATNANLTAELNAIEKRLNSHGY